MPHLKALTVALGLIALAAAPVSSSMADGRHHGGHEFHHFGFGHVVADVVVGIVTLPLAIAAAVSFYEPRRYEREYAEPADYGPAPGYYAPPPNYYQAPAYYSPPAVYYRPAPRYYAPPVDYYGRSAGNYSGHPRYNAPFGQPAAPRPGYYQRPH